MEPEPEPVLMTYQGRHAGEGGVYRTNTSGRRKIMEHMMSDLCRRRESMPNHAP